jgi:hypothetical protein
MSNTIYLYLKTHNKTGLKYFGMTKQDPNNYMGSGKRWRNHLSKHGNNVNTEIIFQSEDKQEISDVGVFYSKMWNIVESGEFANLKIEEGDGGDTSKFINYEDPVMRKRISDAKKGSKPTSGSFKKGSKQVKELALKANKRKKEMRENGENKHWKSSSGSLKGKQTTSTLGHKWYRNVKTGEKSMFINKEVPNGWVTSDEYKKLKRKSNRAWYHNSKRNFLLDRNDNKILDLDLSPGRKKFNDSK